MIFASYVFFTIVLFSFFPKKFKYSTNISLFSSTLLLCIFAGVRDISFGSDLLQYFDNYNGYISVFSYESIWQEYLYGLKKDGLFFIVMKVCRDMGISFQWFMALTSTFYVMSVAWFIYKYSKNQTISFLMFMVLEWFVFSFTGLRQTFAMSFCVIALISLISKQKNIFAFLLIGIAGLFHSSAWIFLIVPLIKKLKFEITPLKFIILIISSVIVAFIGQEFLRTLIIKISWNDFLSRYSYSEITLNWTGFFIQLTFAGISYCAYYKTIKKNPHSSLLYTVMAIGVGFQTFSVIVAEMFRISMYFSIASICIFPMAIDSLENKYWRLFYQYGSYILLFIYLIISAKFVNYISIFD